MKKLKNINILRKYDNNFWIHPYEDLRQIGKTKRSIIQKAKGIYLYDELGNKIIDGPGGMWCVQIGHGRPEICKAIYKQLKKLDYVSPFFNTSEISSLTARKIIELAPGDLNHVFFTTDGSTAVDSALRFVKFYFNSIGLTKKKHIIAQGNSYHGSTHLDASISSRDKYDELYGLQSKTIHFLPSLKSTTKEKKLSSAELSEKKLQQFIQTIEKIGPEKIAVFIAEPVQASGGIIIPPENYLKECARICKKHGIIFIADEVVTGFGRLGHWFSCKEVFGFEPDIITCAKGISSGYLPIGAFLISDKLIQNLGNFSTQEIIVGQGFTYSGHPVSCAAVMKNIEIMEKEKILEHVQNTSPYFQAQLEQFNELKMIKETRGIGFLACVEFRTSKNIELAELSKIINCLAKECQKKGLLVRHYLDSIILSPPLIINDKQIKKLFDILYRSTKKIQDQFF